MEGRGMRGLHQGSSPGEPSRGWLAVHATIGLPSSRHVQECAAVATQDSMVLPCVASHAQTCQHPERRSPDLVLGGLAFSSAGCGRVGAPCVCCSTQAPRLGESEYMC